MTYDAYKPSGIDWIGDIPAHWEVKKLKYCVSLRNEKIADTNGLVIALENIEGGTGRIVFSSEEKKYEGELRAFEKGDVLFNKLRPYLRKVHLAKKEGACVGELLVWEPSLKLDSAYLFYLALSDGFIDDVNSSTYGSKMPRASWEDYISQMSAMLPPLVEQQVIAAYLDEKTAQLDTYVSRKQALIALLKEERAGLINQYLSTKNSQHKKLKYVVSKIGSGVTPSGGANVYQKSGVPLFRSQNIHFDGLRLDDVAFISEETHQEMSNSKVMAGDVLLNITGASIGRCFYTDNKVGEANVNQHVCIIRPEDQILTKYLYTLLASELGQEQIRGSQTGANREGLNFEQLKNFVFPIPPSPSKPTSWPGLSRKRAGLMR